MTTPASGVAALGPPDPQMAALVSHMKAQLDADKAAAAGGGHTPLGTGKAAPDQNVTYSVQSLMGSSEEHLDPRRPVQPDGQTVQRQADERCGRRRSPPR